MDPLSNPALFPFYVLGIAVALSLAWKFGRAGDRVDRDDAVAQQAQADGFSTHEQPMEVLTIRMPAVSPEALGMQGRVVLRYWEKREEERWVLFAELEYDATSRNRWRRRARWIAPPGPDELTLVCVQLPGSGEAQIVAQGSWSVARTQEWAFASRRTDDSVDFRTTLADARAAISRALTEPAAQPLQPVRGR